MNFASIRNHLKGLTFSVILLGNRIISGEFAANNFFYIRKDIRDSVRVSYYSQLHTNDRQCLRTPTNVGDHIAIIANWW